MDVTVQNSQLPDHFISGEIQIKAQKVTSIYDVYAELKDDVYKMSYIFDKATTPISKVQLIEYLQSFGNEKTIDCDKYNKFW